MPDRNLDWVHALFQLGQELSLENSDVLRKKLLEHIVDGFDGQSGSIAVLDDDGQQLTLIVGTGTAANYVGSKIPLGERILGWVTKHNQAVCLHGDVATDPRFKEMRLVSNPGRPVSALCWPLLVAKQAVGAISINRAPDQPPFTEQHLINGAVMVGLIGLVVDNMRTHDAYHRRIAELNTEKEQRAAAEARLKSILDSSEAILSVNEQGQITLFNKGAETVFGYSASEMLGTPMDRLLPERFAAIYANQMRSFAQSEESNRNIHGPRSIWGRRKNGSEFPAEGSIVKVPDGEKIMFTVTLRDITERLQAEDKLQRLGRILDSTVNEIYVFDAHTLNFTMVNQGAQRNLGYSMDELRHMTPLDLKPLYSSQEFYKLLANLGVSADHRTVYETVHRRKDGSRYPVEVRLQYSANEATPVYVVIVEDISERKKAEDELRARQRELEAAYKDLEQAQSQLLQSEKMASVGQLAAGVAHEINNPVGFVNSNLGTLKNYVADLFKLIAAYEQLEEKIPAGETLEQLRALKKKLDLDYLREDASDLVKESIEGLGRVKKIVQDLKEFSHVDSTEWQIADLHAGLNSTLNIAHNELKYKVTVVKEYGEIPPVECIASQINQVFMNMLVNAAHAIETRGTITIRSGQNNEDVWIEIGDTGKGMPPDVQKRIFEPFFTTKPVGKGTGLGLSLAYGIVQKHHGRIEVDSEADKGTRFRIYLPARQPANKAAA